MTAHSEWLDRVQQGHVLIEVASTAHTLVRIAERKGGRLWYANETGPSNLRCVDARTGWSHDMSRHLIPQEPYEDDLNSQMWDMYGPSSITDGIT